MFDARELLQLALGIPSRFPFFDVRPTLRLDRVAEDVFDSVDWSSRYITDKMVL